MARIRTIKPSTWTDPEVIGLSMAARLLWIGTWNFADDYGVLKDDPAELRFQILPGDDVDTYALVDELVSRKMLLRKVAPDGTRVLVIRTFCDHQKIDTRSPGRWGKPDEFQDADRPLSAVPEGRTRPEQGQCTPPNQSPPIPTNPAPGMEGKGPSLMGNPDGSPEPFGTGFAEVWDHYPRKLNRKEALRAYQARRRSGVPHAELLVATINYARSVTGVEKTYIVHGKRFYGPNDYWKSYITRPSPEADERPEVVER